LKKEYCCENRGIGCQQVPISPEQPENVELVPKWLNLWLGDISLGFKFAMSASIALALGFCCGGCIYHNYLKNHAAKRRSRSEQELSAEIKKLLQRLGAKTGELVVTLMWDTTDDLDLHLKLPNGLGEISAECTSVAGGTLDIDGNVCLERGTMKPIENIYWPYCTEKSKDINDHPPLGEYTISVKCFERNQRVRNANLTVVLSISGKEEIFHQTMVEGCSEVKICSFRYTGPVHSHNRHSGHGGSSSSRRSHDDHGHHGINRHH